MSELTHADDMRDCLDELAEEAVDVGPLGEATFRLLGETRTLQSMALALKDAELPNRTLVTARHVSGGMHAGNAARDVLLGLYRSIWESMNGQVEVFEDNCSSATGKGKALRFIVLHGKHAALLAKSEEGTHLFRPGRRDSSTRLTPLKLHCCPILDGETPESVFNAIDQRNVAWRDALAAGRATLADNPFPLKPVIRVYQPPRGNVDLRTGICIEANATVSDVRDMVLGALPLPPELAELAERSDVGDRASARHRC